MTSIPPLGREAIEHARRGDFDNAIATALKAVQAHPEDLGLRVFLAMVYSQRLELDQAVPHLRAAVGIDPADPFARLELVRLLIATGGLDEAEARLAEGPLPSLEKLRLRAMLLQRRGDAASAAQLFSQLVDADPRDFDGWGKLGLCLIAEDRPQEAVDALARSLLLRPDQTSYWYKWGEAHFAAGTAERGLVEARERASRDPSDPAALLAVAHLENLLGRPENALAALEDALAREDSSTDVLVAVAELLELRNNLERLDSILNRLAALPRPPDRLGLLQARLEFRRKDYRRALTLARSAPASADEGMRAQLIGQSLDKLGDAPGAYDAFVRMNAVDATSGAAVRDKPEDYRASIAQQWDLLTPAWYASWREGTPPIEREPAFLVGFPRSGTTLLDTLLMGHPDIAVAEEKPMLPAVGDSLGAPERLAVLDSDQIEELRQLYFRVAEKHVPDAGRRLLIDKYPFAMGSAHIIHRLFPGARIIFLERHPCDVVLSCFMTRFQPTGAATNFLSLTDTALLYDEMMRLWTRSVEHLPLNVHVARYERLIENAEAELRPLADFLGLGWVPQLVENRVTASRRAFIGTPSYAQVSEPITASAVGRWHGYREQLQAVLPVLEPWASRMGYEL